VGQGATRDESQFTRAVNPILAGHLSRQVFSRTQPCVDAGDLLRHVLPRVRMFDGVVAVARYLSRSLGAVDGFFECGLGPWDITAAAAVR
jgi:fructose-1,6-bisphosphatase/inositol monophosphatase family enzyme